MSYQKYIEAIDKLKQKHPEYEDSRFEISDGELSVILDSTCKGIDMMQMQNEVNEILGQKLYSIEFVGYARCWATSENEAREFSRRLVPSAGVPTSIVEIH